MHFLFFVLVGVLAGLVVGMMGAGSSMIILPFLFYFFPVIGVSPALAIHAAAGTSIFILVIGSATAFYFKLKQVGKLDWNIVKWLIPGVIIGALCGATIAHYLPPQILRSYIGFFITLSGLNMLLRRATFQEEMHLPRPWVLSAFSLVSACISGMAGVAVGNLLVPFLRKYNVAINQAILIAVFIAVIYTISGTIGFMINGWDTTGMPKGSIGYVYLPAALVIAASMAMAAPVGVRISAYVPVKVLHYGFGIYILLAGLNLLFKFI